MSGAMDREIGELLERAEERGACLEVSQHPRAECLRKALARRVRAGELVSPMPGLFARASTWECLSRSEQTARLARGLQVRYPSWVFCGPTAAVLAGLDVSDSLQDRLHVACERKSLCTSTSHVAYHAVFGAGEKDKLLTRMSDVKVTLPEQTVFDCLRWTDFARGLGVADSALGTRLVSREDVVSHIEGRHRAHGKARALRAFAHADGRSESGGESIARARMIQLGYVVPELQVEVPKLLVAGRPWRADFCWVRADGSVILGELDGRCKYGDEKILAGRDGLDVLADERLRESRISLYDVAVMRFSFDATRRPSTFSALMDAYGVPKVGSALALPEGVPMVPDWEALRRR